MPSNNAHYTIVYLTNMRVPTEKAHGLATAKICEAFVECGAAVELVAPKLWRRSGGDFFEYYGLKVRFPLHSVPTIDLLWLNILKRGAFLLQLFSFSIAAALYCAWKYRNRRRNVIFFSHDSVPLYFVSWFFPNIFYDIHHFPSHSFLYDRVMKRSFGLSVQTKWKIDALEKDFHVPRGKIVYWPNGTDVAAFQIDRNVSEVRKELGIPEQKKIVIYAGQLFDWKGVETLLSATPFLAGNVLIYIVGGSFEDKERIQRELPAARDGKIRYVPFQPHERIPLWLHAADVLVLPNTGKQKVSLYYTSPMKLFEYMASGKPIVASDIPAIREILDEGTGYFAKADNSESFARAIEKAITDPNALSKGESARQKARQFTWNARAKKILEHMIVCLENKRVTHSQ